MPPFQPQVYTYACDVGKRESVYSTAEKVRREVGNVDILINNAGVVSGHHLLECPDELIERTMVVNCHAHFWVSKIHLRVVPMHVGYWGAYKYDALHESVLSDVCCSDARFTGMFPL